MLRVHSANQRSPWVGPAFLQLKSQRVLRGPRAALLETVCHLWGAEFERVRLWRCPVSDSQGGWTVINQGVMGWGISSPGGHYVRKILVGVSRGLRVKWRWSTILMAEDWTGLGLRGLGTLGGHTLGASGQDQRAACRTGGCGRGAVGSLVLVLYGVQSPLETNWGFLPLHCLLCGVDVRYGRWRQGGGWQEWRKSEWKTKRDVARHWEVIWDGF